MSFRSKLSCARAPDARSRSLRCAALGALAAPLALMSLGGCGRGATREDCEAIFRQSALLELRAQHITDPQLSEERVVAVRNARGEPLVQQCLGRRITDKALRCVQAATDAAELERCLE